MITVHSVLDVWILSMYHYTRHDHSYVFYYKSYGPSSIFCKHNVLMSLKILMDVERWLLVGYYCVIHHWKAVYKHYNLRWNHFGNELFWRTLWLVNWKYCWIWPSKVSQSSILVIFLFNMKEYLNAYISSSEVNFEILTMSALWARLFVFPL